MPVPSEILKLVERFNQNREDYESGQYKETQIRVEFIDPFFKALGWDVHNENGYAEAYKDVIHEDALKIGDSTEAPDACFRIGGARKFFVECKKPSVSIKDSIHPAYQLRRYGWSAKLPLSILTDFQEFAVYDCRVKPVKNDSAAIARVRYLTCEQYADKWDELAAIFSREAVLRGSFDKFAETTKGKKGTADVDDAFLEEIERWRDVLARNIAIRNPNLTQRELNFSVQRTIDRIVFLRICEDRGIEPYGRLMTLKTGERVYPRLCEFFQRADERYNSGLFHFQPEKERPECPDELTLHLDIDDKALREIIGNLYYPESPYEFSVLPADILGQVYERFLGKVIRLTAGHQAKVEEKPEVRKAGGVYYTPTYIAEYIVKNTVGKLAEGKTPKQVAKLKILDDACGSGTFLIAAYQFLLDWHRDWYVNDGVEKHAKVLYQAGNDYRLTTDEKKRILLNNIFGVDIDSQAVEVTKLSLLLKVLEGESQQSLDRQLSLFHKRALPDLGRNIKCGNSLIGPDFYQGQQMDLLSEEEQVRINVFDWKKEFPEIMGAGGFDAIIGNPPYGADYTAAEKTYFQNHYVYSKGKPETYIFFIERGVSLLRDAGKLGYITPNAWLTNYYGVQLRRYLFPAVFFDQLVDLEPTRVFEEAVVDTAITLFTKGKPPAVNKLTKVLRGTKGYEILPLFDIDQGLWSADPEGVINLLANQAAFAILIRLERSGRTFGELVEFSQGVIPYKTKEDGQRNLHISATRQGEAWLPLIENASQVKRYSLDAPRSFIHYGPWLWCARDSRFFSEPKILLHRVRKKLPRQLVGALDLSGVVNRHSLSNLILRPGVSSDQLRAVLGLFNSTLANWWFVKRFGLLMEVGGFKLSRLPLPATWETGYGKVVCLVDKILDLHKRLGVARTPDEKNSIQRRIDGTDGEIDRLVYELYGLTEDEIKIVEGCA